MLYFDKTSTFKSRFSTSRSLERLGTLSKADSCDNYENDEKIFSEDDEGPRMKILRSWSMCSENLF